MANEGYFLPAGYAPNPAVTLDADGERYWDAGRLHTSLAYQAAVYEWARELIGSNGIRTVADFGCGNAAKLAALQRSVPDVDYWGFDQPNAIAACRAHYDFGHWIAVNLDKPADTSEGRFGLIISSDVIEHLEDPDVLLGTIRSMASPDSLILLSTPERVRLRGERCMHSPNPYHVREWSKPELARYLQSRGFHIVEHRLLPAFRVTHDRTFFVRALKRWSRLKSIAYNQAVLATTAQPAA